MSNRAEKKNAAPSLGLGMGLVVLLIIGALSAVGFWFYLGQQMEEVAFQARVVSIKPAKACPSPTGLLGSLFGGGDPLKGCSLDLVSEVRVVNPLFVPLQVEVQEMSAQISGTEIEDDAMSVDRSVVVIPGSGSASRELKVHIGASELLSMLGGLVLTQRVHVDVKAKLRLSSWGVEQEREARVEHSWTVQEIMQGVDGTALVE